MQSKTLTHQLEVIVHADYQKVLKVNFTLGVWYSTSTIYFRPHRNYRGAMQPNTYGFFGANDLLA